MNFKIKKLIINLMFYFPFMDSIIFILTNKRFYLKKLVWIDELLSLKVLKEKETCIIYSPDLGNGHQEIISVSPKISLYILENVFCSSNSSSFYDNKNVFVENFFGIEQSDADYSSGHLIKHNLKRGLIRENKISQIDKTVFFLAGNGSFNYFHWLIEILPKLLFLNNNLIKEFKIDAIFVNSRALEIMNFKLALDLLAKKLGLDIIFASENENLSFSKVIYISTFNQVLYNSKSQKINIKDNYFYINSLVELRQTVFESNEIKNIQFNKNYPKKFFLKRGKVSSFNKRDYNEEEIYLYFKEKGFEGLKIEEYSFFEQAYLFQNAEIIIGPSGAFWSNLIFCQAGTKAISWLPEKISSFSTYSTLAKYFGVKKKFLVAKSLNKNMHGEYTVNLENIRKLYEYDFLN